MDALLHVNDAVSRLPASPSRPLSSRSTRSMSSSKQWDRIRAIITLVTRTPNKENNHNGGRRKTKKNAGPSSSARNICVQCVCGNPVSLDNPYSPATLQPQNMNFTANSQQLEGKAPTDCTTPQTMDSQTALWDRTPRQHHKVHKDSET
jgi:hypothetical protein